MKSKLCAMAAVVSLSLVGLPALAHHSFAAEFDQNKPIKITGSVTRFDLINPHAWIYLDVTGADGKVVNWGFETAAVSGLYRRGLRKDTLTPGMMITIEGYQARDGKPVGNAQKMTLPDGSTMVLGTEQNPG